MITKTAAGLRFISNRRTWSRGRKRFDPWAVHAVLIDAVDNATCLSGKLVDFTPATLVDGNTYAYICNAPYIFPDYSSVGNLYALYQVPGYPGNWPGEAYNAVVRPAAFTKMTIVDFVAYVAAN